MDILIGCEESGTVRDAFAALGHNAYSNDIIAARNGGNHLHCCVMEAIDSRIWDIIILHPDCTKVCVAGNKTWAATKEREEHAVWISTLWEKAKTNARIGCALENPASVIWPRLRPRATAIQFIQPWQFGHMEQKKTGLALFNLPPLIETNNVYNDMMRLPIHIRERIHYMAPGPNRKRDRSKTFDGIAKAFALQWGSL